MPQFRIRKFRFQGKEYRVVSSRDDEKKTGVILVTVVEDGKGESEYQILEVIESEVFEPIYNWML